MCQLLPTLQDLGDLTLEAPFLVLQGLHGPLRAEQGHGEGRAAATALPAPQEQGAPLRPLPRLALLPLPPGPCTELCSHRKQG